MAPIKRGDVVLVDLPFIVQDEIILTIPQSLISRKLGALTEPVMREIEKRLIIFY